MIVRSLAILLCLVGALGAAPRDRTLSLDVQSADLFDVFRLLSAQSRVNIVADSSVKHEKVTLRLSGVSFREALSILAEAFDLQVHRSGNVYVVGSSATMNRRYPSDAATSTVAFPLGNARADEIVKALADALPPSAVVLADKRAGSVVVSGDPRIIERAKTLVAALDVPSRASSSAIPLRYVRPSDALKQLKGVVPENAVVADDRQNAILVSGNAETLTTVRSFLQALDVPSPQVMLEVRVADVQPVNETSNVGLQFGGIDLSGQPLSGAATYTFAKNSLSVNARLNALVQSGHAQILATPRLLTLNNREANLLVGQTYPIVYYDIRSGNQQVQYIDVGVKLRLTPTIGPGGTVTAELHPEYSAVQGFVSGYPILASRKVDATLRVGNDETIVLGGLLRDIDAETVTKLPILGDVPVFGELFRNRQRSHVRDEIVFLITPHVF